MSFKTNCQKLFYLTLFCVCSISLLNFRVFIYSQSQVNNATFKGYVTVYVLFYAIFVIAFTGIVKSKF